MAAKCEGDCQNSSRSWVNEELRAEMTEVQSRKESEFLGTVLVRISVASSIMKLA